MNKQEAIDILEKYNSMLKFFEKFANQMIKIDKPYFIDWHSGIAESVYINEFKESVTVYFVGGRSSWVFNLEDAFKPREEFLLEYKEKLLERQELKKIEERQFRSEQDTIKQIYDKFVQSYNEQRLVQQYIFLGENLI